ncbi:hypothetical protein C0Z18_12945 [Trinickia dabaoshanensis]|jgi:glutamine amidotransferase|uniref:Glutamine amidotransferase type-2 domain-containing protein n=1 Tax=Trinickia dabaoshanensis TaxID=564714 RepID=A0A2N7VRN3_9BURK|nr:class II glutamine amidotransferase [Trinickia dabaoshanensis]PMS19827.1 hypothetical protein C0Z18_12945 [Trinickia dabaoshanensis]TAM51864.1 MAG: hypothetical protein EPN57_15715 [Paraburkholderia sp.]
MWRPRSVAYHRFARHGAQAPGIHNGRLDGIAARSGAEQSFRPVGTTDSELAFCLLLDYLAPLWHAGSIPEIGDRLDRVTRFAADMREMGPANFLYADSEVVFAHGDRRTQTDGSVTPPGLWSLCRKCAVDADALTRAGVTIGGGGGEQEIVLFASVPLTSERPWHQGRRTHRCYPTPHARRAGRLV